jgi:hypothetical protein
LNVAGIAILLQSALILQPTHTPGQKYTGTITHSILNGAVLALMGSALVVIVVNKLNHHGQCSAPSVWFILASDVNVQAPTSSLRMPSSA